MSRRLVAMLAAAIVLTGATAGACDSPEGTACTEGTRVYSGEHGNFVCVDGRYVKA